MKKIFILAASCLFVGCTSDEINETQVPSNEPELQGVVMSIPDFTFDESENSTRTTISPTSTGMSFAWKAGDKVGIYATSSMANFDIDQISQDAKSATFDGGGFSLTEGSTYYAFYPYNGSSTDKTQIPVSYTGQVQAENSSSAHLGNYDYMVAKATATGTNTAQFNFAHLGAIMRVKVTVPQAGTYTSLTLSSSGTKFVTAGTVDITSNTPTITSTSTSSDLTLQLGNSGITLAASNLTLTTYIIVAPQDMSSSSLSIYLTDCENRTYATAVQGKNMNAGGAYAYSGTAYEYVDLGLSVRWATCNVGTNLPTSVGDKYAWGELNTKSSYSWGNYFDTNDGGNTFIKYNKNGGKVVLDLDNDVAHANLGGNWHIPSFNEQNELLTKCYWEWVTNYKGQSISGYVVYKVKAESDKGLKKHSGSYLTPSATYSLADNHIFILSSPTDDVVISNSTDYCYWSS